MMRKNNMILKMSKKRNIRERMILLRLTKIICQIMEMRKGFQNILLKETQDGSNYITLYLFCKDFTFKGQVE
jgi:hypothetical protein